MKKHAVLYFLLMSACSIPITLSPTVKFEGNQITLNQQTIQGLKILSSSKQIKAFCAGEPIEGDFGYARSVAREYRQMIDRWLSLNLDVPQSNGSQPRTIPEKQSASPSASSSQIQPPVQSPNHPEVQISPAILSSANATDTAVKEKTTFHGTVYDDNGIALDGVMVKAKSLNAGVTFEATTTTVGGTFAFNNAPGGIQIEIVVSKTGLTTRRRVEVIKANLQGDPKANVFDFGTFNPNQPVRIPTPSPGTGKSLFAPTTIPTPTPTPSAVPTPMPLPRPSETNYFFFSYDDSASTAGVELTKNALLNRNQPSSEWARPWEFLNYETFDHYAGQSKGLFNVSMGLWKHPSVEQNQQNTYEMGGRVSAPTLCKAARKNLVLTLLVDVSGSMNEPSPLAAEPGQPPPTLIEILKFGLEQMLLSLKEGDIINIVEFADKPSVRLESYPYVPGDHTLSKSIQELDLMGRTDINAGIDKAYQVALKHYDPDKINRVVMLTDAISNTGETNPKIIAEKTRMNDREGIYFSGLGFGQQFKEDFLNILTEAGRGAYYSIITKMDVKRAFQDRFMALINVAAREVRFRLEYPSILHHGQSGAEQVSQVIREVQATNFSYNTSQYFWEAFDTASENNLLDHKLTLRIFYTDPQTKAAKVEMYEATIGQLLEKEKENIQAAHMVNLLTGLLKGNISRDSAQKELATLLKDVGN